jgi:hypothetical protein
VSDHMQMLCPLCGMQLDIRESKKSKPYVVCDPCGMQMFIRKEHGIGALKKVLTSGLAVSNPSLEKLREKTQSLEKQLLQAEQKYEAVRGVHAELAQTKNRLREKDQEMTKSQSGIQALEERISDLERLILRTCPVCDEEFQIREDLIKTSWLDGRFQGFQCPKNGCKGIVLPRAKED